MKPTRAIFCRLPLLSFIAIAFSASNSSADTFTWVPTTTGTYNWIDTANWGGVDFPDAIGDVANFNINIGAAQTVNLGQTITVGEIKFGDTGSSYFGVNIAPNGGSLVMQASSGNALLTKVAASNNATDTISSGVLLGSDLTANIANSTVAITGSITGVGRSITKTGAGTLTLSGSSNTFSGGVTLNAGTLNLGSNSALGTGTFTINGGTLNDNGTTFTSSTNTAIVLNGNFSKNDTVGRTMNMGSGAVTLNTALAISGNHPIRFDGTVSGPGGLNALDITSTGSGSQVIFGAGITLSSTLKTASGISSGIWTSAAAIGGGTNGMNAAGNVNLNGNNTFTGRLTVLSGTTRLSGTNQAGSVVINTGAGLALSDQNMGTTGTINTATTIYNNGTLTLGAGRNYAQGADFGSITGSGNVTIVTQHGESVTLTGTNTHGSTTVGNSSYGPLVIIDGDAALGSAGGLLTLVRGTLRFATGSTVNIGRTVTMSGNTTTSVDTSLAAGTISGEIRGTGNLTKSGANNLTLSGVNTFTGNTIISGGKIVMGNALALQNSAYDTTGSTGAIGLDLNGGTTLTLGGLAGNVALATAITGYGSATSLTLNPQSGKSVTYSNAIGDGGGLSLIKTGAGTQILAGANTYTGSTTIKNGTLQLNRQTGSLAGGALTFNDGGGTFNMDNTGASGTLAQSLGALTFSAGDGTVKLTRTAAQNLSITFSSLAARSAGATGNFWLSSGTASAANGIVLTGQATGFIDQGMFYGGGTSTASYAYYDASGFVRGINYGTDASTATVAGGAALSTGFSHVQTTGAITAQGTDTFSTIRIQNTANSAQAFTLGSGATLTTNGILRAGNGGTSSTTTISGGTGIQAANNGELVIRTDMSNDLLTISTPILANGTNSLTKSGAGTLKLTTSNNYSGGTALNAGTLTVANSGALGAGTLTINGGTLRLESSLTSNNAIVANGDFSLGGFNNINTGTGSFKISKPITISGGGDNDPYQGVVISNTITDASGGNTLNALDLNLIVTGSTSAITLGGNITLRGNQTFTSTMSGGTTSGINISGNIGQSASGQGVTFAGSGTVPSGSIGRGPGVVLMGANTYTGATTINPGVTVVLGRGTVGSLHTSSSIVNNGYFVLNRSDVNTQGTHFGTISGAGEVMQSAGTTTLNAANSYTGVTTTFGGTLSIATIGNAGSNSTLGNYASVGASGIALKGGTLQYTGGTTSTDRGFTLGASSTVSVSTAGATLTMGDSTLSSGTLSVTGGTGSGLSLGHVSLIGNATVSPSTGSLTTAGMNGWNYTLSKTGAGALNLNGTTAVGGLNVGQNAAGGTATAGSNAKISVGTGSSSALYVGANSGSSNPVGSGTLDLTNAESFTANVGTFGVGYSSAPTSQSGTSIGVFTLGGTGTVRADNFYAGVGQSSGSGGNFATNGSFSLASGATLNLTGSSATRANLYVGWSFGGGNASTQVGNMNLSSGTANLTLSQLWVGRGSNSVSGTGTLTLSSSYTNHLDVNGAGSVVTIGATSGTASTGTVTLRNLDATSAVTSTDNSTAILLGANANATGNLTVSGSTLTITTTGSAIARVAGTGNLTLDNTTLVAGASNAVSGKWITGLTTATLTNTVTFDSGANTISTDQAFSGTGGLTKKGAGTLSLSGTNSFGGQLSVQAGTLAIATINNASANGVLGNSANAVSLGNTGSVTGTLQYTGASASSSKKFTMAAGGTGAFQVDNSGTNLSLSGVIDGSGNLTKTGAGTLTLTAGTTHNYTGSTYVTEGTLVVDGNISTSSLTTIGDGVNAATFGGSGTVGDLTISTNAFHNPGNSPGIVNTGDYTMAGTLNIEVNGTTPGVTGHDQVNVTGAVNLSGSLNVAFGGGTYVNGDMIFILLNDSNDAITGTFSGLAQGATVTTYGGYSWIISYTADSNGTPSPTFTGGNDVVLMAVPEPAAAILGSIGMVLLLRRRRVA